MSIFTPLNPNDTQYNFLDIQLYELAVKNKFTTKEHLKLFNDAKYFLDIIAYQSDKYKETLKFNNKFKELGRQIIIKTLEGLTDKLIDVKEESELNTNSIVFKTTIDISVGRNDYGITYFEYISRIDESILLFHYMLSSYFLEFLYAFANLRGDTIELDIFEVEKYKIKNFPVSIIFAIRAIHVALYDYFIRKYSLTKLIE